MNCPHCQTYHSVDGNYCIQTGKAIEPTALQVESVAFCEHCGTRNVVNYSYCASCGNGQVITTMVQQPSIVTPQYISPVVEPAPQFIPPAPTITVSEAAQVATVQTNSIAKPESFLTTFFTKSSFILPAFIPLLILVAVAFSFTNSVKEKFAAIDDVLNTDMGMFFDNASVKDVFLGGIELESNVSEFPLLANQILLMNNNTFKAAISDGWDENFIEFKVFYLFLLIPIGALFFGGIVYGFIGRKRNWGVQNGVIIFTALYTLFNIGMNLLGQYTLSFETGEGDAFEIIFTPSMLESIFNAIVLSAIISFVSIYISYYGKQTFQQLQREHAMAKHTFYAILAAALSLLGNFVIAYFVVQDKLSSLNLISMFIKIPAILENLLIVTMGTISWGESYFGELSFSDDRFMIGIVENVIHSFIPDQYLLVAITAIIFIFIGYKVGTNSESGLVDSLNIAIMFTVIQMVIVYLFSVSLKGEGDGDFYLYLGFTYLSVAIGAFLTSAIGTFIGTLFSKKN